MIQKLYINIKFLTFLSKSKVYTADSILRIQLNIQKGHMVFKIFDLAYINFEEKRTTRKQNLGNEKYIELSRFQHTFPETFQQLSSHCIEKKNGQGITIKITQSFQHCYAKIIMLRVNIPSFLRN